MLGAHLAADTRELIVSEGEPIDGVPPSPS